MPDVVTTAEFVYMLVTAIIVTLLVVAYAMHCLLVVVRDTADGNDEVTWPAEPFQDWAGAALHLVVVIAAWLAPVGLLARALRKEWLPDDDALRFLLLAVPGLWLLFPVALFSSLSGSSPWFVFRPIVVWKLLRGTVYVGGLPAQRLARGRRGGPGLRRGRQRLGPPSPGRRGRRRRGVPDLRASPGSAGRANGTPAGGQAQGREDEAAEARRRRSAGSVGRAGGVRTAAGTETEDAGAVAAQGENLWPGGGEGVAASADAAAVRGGSADPGAARMEALRERDCSAASSRFPGTPIAARRGWCCRRASWPSRHVRSCWFFSI